LWAALLRAGPGAIFSHTAAAELYGLVKPRPGAPIQPTVPSACVPDRTGKISGVIIHRSRNLGVISHPTLTPPRTRIEETVLDLIAAAPGFDAGYEWICKAVGNRLTTAERIRLALDQRRNRVNLAVAQIVTMRFGHLDLRTPQAQCRTAAEVAGILRTRDPRVGTACKYSGCPL
jgi:hypothetical protein